MYLIKNKSILSLIILMTAGVCQAQFLDSFDTKNIVGWFFFTGDGDATMDFVQMDGFARIEVDATKD